MSGDLQAKNVPLTQQKSRIPQRLPAGKNRWLPKSKMNSNDMKNKEQSAVPPHRPTPKCSTRPTSAESRPKSANKAKEEVNQFRDQMEPVRVPRIERERLLPAQKRAVPVVTKRNTNERLKDVAANRPTVRPVITVPKQKLSPRTTYTNRTSCVLPDQETIKRCEELEAAQDDFTDSFNMQSSNGLSDNDEESLTTRSEKLIQLKMTWQEKLVQFEKMKNELNDRQNAILQVYAGLRTTQQKLVELGQQTPLPKTEDLKVMNVAKMTPAQLLQLCEESKRTREDLNIKDSLPLDMNKLNNIPKKVIDTSERILNHQREFTNWFQNVINQEKECSIRTLSRKLNEFNSENDMLNGLLHSSQNEFLKEVSDIMEFLRKCVNEAISSQLKSEKLTYELSELNSKVTDLRKQLNSAEHLKVYNNKIRIEELEKELREEKIKNKTIRDRLLRSDAQVKIEAERVTNLEAALKQSRCHIRQLERTELQLRDQNEKLQSDFETELTKLNQSIKENSSHLEEIARAREKLQSEKEDLEKRLEELSTTYNESISKLKHELNNKVTQLIEIEKSNFVEAEEKKKLQGLVESQCAQLVEAELRYKDIVQKLQDYENQNKELQEKEKKLECLQEEFQSAQKDIEQYKNQLLEQVNISRTTEKHLNDYKGLEEKLKLDLKCKDDYITKLEKKISNLEQQLRESESKMGPYEEQLCTLKGHILQLQECFGDYEDINDLRDLLNQHREKLEATQRENIELSAALQRRNLDFESLVEKEAKLSHDVKQRDDIIKVLSQKEEEQANIIKLLRNNLGNISRLDSNLNRQLMEKNEEIDVLMNSLETRKGQISQLEKIILTLEDQIHKANQQKQKDHERIEMLESKLDEYRTFIDSNNNNIFKAPTKHLDSLFEILEDELGNSFEQQFVKHKTHKKMQRCIDDNQNNHNKQKCHTIPAYMAKDTPTECLKENIAIKKETHETNRNMANHEIETCEWIEDLERNNFAVTSLKEERTSVSPVRDTNLEKLTKEKHIARNLQLRVPEHIRDHKKYRMLKLASHRL